ncbi:MAG: nucleotidyltransferase domain-containing protein [Thiobacillus sp.]
MRLTPEQAGIIRQAAHQAFGSDADVWLFGSRVHDSKRGGDIDLYIETEGGVEDVLDRELAFHAALQRRLGEQRIDIVVHRQGVPLRPIDIEVRATGVRL